MPTVIKPFLAFLLIPIAVPDLGHRTTTSISYRTPPDDGKILAKSESRQFLLHERYALIYFGGITVIGVG
jgi:hypothetical protein